MHAILLIGNKTAACGALNHLDRQFPLAESARGIIKRNDALAVRTAFRPALCQDRRKKEEEEDCRGKKKTDQAPRKPVPALFVCDQSAGQAGQNKYKKPIHLSSSAQ